MGTRHTSDGMKTSRSIKRLTYYWFNGTSELLPGERAHWSAKPRAEHKLEIEMKLKSEADGKAHGYFAIYATILPLLPTGNFFEM